MSLLRLRNFSRKMLQELSKPKSYVKGEEFEHYLEKFIFPKEYYSVIEKTHDYVSNKKNYVNSSRNPDFKFKSRNNGKIFWVEAKYRSYFFDDYTVECCKEYQLKRYKEINKTIPVFLLLGLGNSPTLPDLLFSIPVKYISSHILFLDEIEPFVIQPNVPINIYNLWNLLFQQKKY